MGRLLAHLFVTTVLVAVPALRVLCFSSCAPGASTVTESMVTPDATPACHEHNKEPHSQPVPESGPQEDDCSHGGESSLSGLKASEKLARSDGPTVALASTVPSTPPLTISTDVRSDTPVAFHTGQSLGLFLTPLRI